MAEKADSCLKAIYLRFALAILLCFCAVPGAYAADTVEQIEAIVVTDDNTQLAEPVVRRIEASVATVGDSLLLGKEVTDEALLQELIHDAELIAEYPAMDTALANVTAISDTSSAGIRSMSHCRTGGLRTTAR